MATYVLILYLSTGFLQTATGGPVAIDGFTSLEKCTAELAKAKTDLPKFDWGQCRQVEK
jgi:hypothetical protein